MRENAYCPSCGNMMFSKEVNISYYQHNCCGCSYIIDSRLSSYYPELEKGRARHLWVLQKGMASAEAKLQEAQEARDEAGCQGYERLLRVIADQIEQFRQEERKRLSWFFGIDKHPREVLAQQTPFGMSLFEEKQ